MGCDRGESLFVQVPALRDVVRRADADGIPVGPLKRPWVDPKNYQTHPTQCRAGLNQVAGNRTAADFGSRRCSECLKSPEGAYWFDVRDRALQLIGVTHVLTVATSKLRGLLQAQHPVNARAVDSAFGYYRRVVEMTHRDGDQSKPTFWITMVRRWLEGVGEVDGIRDRDMAFMLLLVDRLEGAWNDWEAFLAEVPAPGHAVWRHTRALADDCSLFDEPTEARAAPRDEPDLLAYVRVNEAGRHASTHNHYPTPADVVLCLALERELVHSREPSRGKAQYIHTYARDLPLPPAGWPGLEVLPAPAAGWDGDRELIVDHAFDVAATSVSPAGASEDAPAPFADVLAAIAGAYA